MASHAEGSDTLSSGEQAHAEGWKSEATGPRAHAEGQKTKATGLGAHAEGDSTVAGGNGAHAEGFNTQALGGSSHAEGWGTIAHKDINAQHVQGRWNKPLAFPYVHIVGYGTGDTDRKNIHTLDKDGNARFLGDVYIGGTESRQGSRLATIAEVNELLLNKRDINDFLPLAGTTDGFMSANDKKKLDNLETQVGSIDTALDELHAYATSLIGGEA